MSIDTPFRRWQCNNIKNTWFVKGLICKQIQRRRSHRQIVEEKDFVSHLFLIRAIVFLIICDIFYIESASSTEIYSQLAPSYFYRSFNLKLDHGIHCHHHQGWSSRQLSIFARTTRFALSSESDVMCCSIKNWLRTWCRVFRMLTTHRHKSNILKGCWYVKSNKPKEHLTTGRVTLGQY